MGYLLTIKGITLDRSDWLDRLNKNSAWDDNGCLIWRGAVTSNGYGSLGISGKIFSVHRLRMQVYLSRELSLDELTCHHCDVRRCNAVSHLYVGDNNTNMKDMIDRGRNPIVGKGESNHKAKLTPDDVIEIRRLLTIGVSDTHLSYLYSISKRTVLDLKNCATWSHL